MSDVISVNVGTQSWALWESVRISCGLGKLAGEFDMEISDAYAKQGIVRPIAAGSAVTIDLNGETVVTGYINKPRSKRSAEDHSIQFTGKDKTCDLEQCCVVQPGLSLAGLDLGQLAKKLCAPFGIKVIIQTDLGGPFPIANIEPGQKLFELLDHMAQLRGVLLTSDGLGNLLLTQPGEATAPDKIEMGVNALKNDGYTDLDERHSDYYCFTQLSQGAADTVTDAGLNIQGYAKDKLVPRYRPFAFQGEMSIDPKYAQKRANWKRNVQAALSQQVTHTLRGWSHSKGLWRHNTLVSVTDADFQLDNALRLISSVTYRKDEEDGTLCDIITVGRHAYDRLAVPEEEMLMELAG